MNAALPACACGARRHAAAPSRQRGAIVILCAFSLSILLALFALAIDLSQVYARRTDLQNAADAAALAGARSLQSSSGTAAAISAAATAATTVVNHYGYSKIALSFPAGALSFAASASSVTWLTKAQAMAAPAGLHCVRVDASAGDSAPVTVATAFAAGIGGPASVQVPAIAVAGPINAGVGLRL
jgi:Flp pilus assembly protein TadG